MLQFVLSYLDMASMKSRDRLLKLILASLDYRRAEISRIILSKILTASPTVKSLNLYSEQITSRILARHWQNLKQL
jgi:hypothetical protein